MAPKWLAAALLFDAEAAVVNAATELTSGDDPEAIRLVEAGRQSLHAARERLLARTPTGVLSAIRLQVG